MIDRDDEIRQMVRDRDEAFTRFVMEDDMGALMRYCRKYGVHVPINERVVQGGVYKAALHCTNIPDEVKRVAREKCAAIGMNPDII